MKNYFKFQISGFMSVVFFLLLAAYCRLPCSAQIYQCDFETWMGDKPVDWNFEPSDVIVTKYTNAYEGMYACKVQNVVYPGHATMRTSESFPIFLDKSFFLSFAALMIRGAYFVEIAINDPITGLNYYNDMVQISMDWEKYMVEIPPAKKWIGFGKNMPANTTGVLSISMSASLGVVEYVIDDLRLDTVQFYNQTLDINQIKADIDPLFLFRNGFEAPRNSGKMTIFASNLWLGGLDETDRLHVAAHKYCQQGTDFFKGPMSNDYDFVFGEIIVSEEYKEKYYHPWKVSRAEINYHKAHYADPEYEMPWAIANWPAHGRTQFEESANLAPYTSVSGKPSYTPSQGDYPAIRGDQAVFFIMNDAMGNHTESGSPNPLMIEILGMAYAYNMPDSALNNNIFISYTLSNKSSNSYKDFYFGFFSDFDIGFAKDDYIGCDTLLNLGYGYNGEAIDGNGEPTSYGVHPPAQGAMFLNTKMNGFTYQNNDESPSGDPMTPSEYYNYLQGKWRDGTPLTLWGTGLNTGSTDYTRFAFSGDPVAGAGWSEVTPYGFGSNPNNPYDRRGMMSAGPFTLPAGDSFCVDIALPFARDYQGDNLSSVVLLKQRAQAIQQFYKTQNFGNHCALPTGIKGDKPAENKLTVYPNPTTGELRVMSEELRVESVELFDIYGRKCLTTQYSLLATINIAHLPAGIYFLRVAGQTVKVVKY